MPDRAPAVLLCAPTGTGLSAVTKRLVTKGPTVLDLEDVLCSSYRGDRELGIDDDEVPNMEKVSRLARAELKARWQTTASELVKILKESQSTQSRVMALHLTWHNSSTNEFFSPVEVESLKPCQFKKVVVLIDEVYDMFSRLEGEDDPYSPGSLVKIGKQLQKFNFPVDSKSADYSLVAEQQKLAAIECAVNDLMLWRRFEMLQAENVAHALGAELTLLATKHSFASLELILGSLETPRIYLSHRITEVRKMNKKSSTHASQLGTWTAIAPEVNQLHQEFACHAQVLINPTAIDELRFCDPISPMSYSANLSARWPIPNPTGGLLFNPSINGPEHSSFFRPGGLPAVNATASSVVRAVTSKIFIDIASRDHYIVEHTPGLLVYRPFFCENYSNPKLDTNWSGGVKPEIMHWLKNSEPNPKAIRRAGFVHTDLEIRGRLLWLHDERNYEDSFRLAVRRHVGDKLELEKFPPGEIEDILAGRIVEPDGSHLNFNPSWFLKQRSTSVIGWIESFGLAALQLVFTMMRRPHYSGGKLDDNIDVAILVRQEDGDRNATDLSEIVLGLTGFFAGESPSIDLNSEFWSVVESIFPEVFGMNISEAAFAALGLSKIDLTELN